MDRSFTYDVFEQAAFEERLKEARARRAIALANRSSASGSAPRRPGPPFGEILLAPRSGRIRSETDEDIADASMEGTAEQAFDVGLGPVGVAPDWEFGLRRRMDRLMEGAARLIPSTDSNAMIACIFVAGLVLGSGGTLLGMQGRLSLVPTDAPPAAMPQVPDAHPILTTEPEPWIPAVAVVPTATFTHATPRPAPLVTAPASVAAPAVVPVVALEKSAEPLPAVDETPLSQRLAGRPYPRPAPDFAVSGEDETIARPTDAAPAEVSAALTSGVETDQASVALGEAGLAQVTYAAHQAPVDGTEVRYVQADDADGAREPDGAPASAHEASATTPSPGTGAPQVRLADTSDEASPEEILRILREHAPTN